MQALLLDGNWRRFSARDALPNFFARQLADHEVMRDLEFPALRRHDCVFAFSDYAGGPKDSHFHIGIVLIGAPAPGIREWRRRWERARHSLGLGRRTVEFKKLNDGARRRAVAPFLRSCEALPGLCATLAVEREAFELFQCDPATYRDLAAAWKPIELAKARWTTFLLAALAAGLTARGQRFQWISDNDGIFGSAAHHEDTHNLFVDHLLAFDSEHYLRFVVGTQGDVEDESISPIVGDLLALPDLVVGAQEATLDHFRRTYRGLSPVLLPVTSGRWNDSKHGTGRGLAQRQIESWMSARGQPLKRMRLAVRWDSAAGELHLSVVDGSHSCVLAVVAPVDRPGQVVGDRRLKYPGLLVPRW